MGKLLLVLLIGIAGGVFITQFFNVQVTPKSAMQLTETASPTITTNIPDQTKPSVAPSIAKIATKGSVDIEIGYPAGGIPPLKVCLFAVPAKVGAYTQSLYCETTATNQTELTLAVDPGSYHIFAWPADDQYKLVGSWTPAVKCGLSVDCKDHSPLALTVKSDQITSGVEIKDWYGDGVGYPTKP